LEKATLRAIRYQNMKSHPAKPIKMVDRKSTEMMKIYFKLFSRRELWMDFPAKIRLIMGVEQFADASG
jgi:hypothetical protein